MGDVVLVISVVLLLVAVLGLARMGWRLVRGNEEPQAGGSLGTQLFGRRRDESGKR